MKSFLALACGLLFTLFMVLLIGGFVLLKFVL